jgi:aryl-alcohol dehydrogenase-like predicted oxidoreductase
MTATARPRTITLGGVEVARIGLGTNRLSSTPEHVELIRGAVAAGVSHIDTAYTYAGGESERTIGAALSPKPETVVVATKGGYAPGAGRPEILRQQIDESLGRLGVDAIDLYYLHRAHPETPFEDSVGALREAVDAGKIRHVGLSQVGVELIEQARAIVPIAAVQNHYNLTERGWDGVVEHCARQGIVFVPYFPLRDEATGVENVAAHRRVTPAQVRLAWLLARSPNTLPIPGTLSLEHVRENLAALDLELTDDEVAALS